MWYVGLGYMLRLERKCTYEIARIPKFMRRVEWILQKVTFLRIGHRQVNFLEKLQEAL
jgi:hypothetical protein